MILFSQPWGLLALLSIPAILLLYALRPKRVKLKVSSNRLWQEALRDRQRGQGLQKLLRDLSLLLLLGFALLLSLALAGTVWSTSSLQTDDAVLVLDVSASMQATLQGGSSRFSEARQQAQQIIDGLDKRGRLLLMTSGRQAILQTAFESDRALLSQTLKRLTATDEAGDPKQALSLALSLLQSRESGKVFFITDNAFDSIPELDTSRIDVRSVEGPSRNVAITRFDYRPEIGSPDRHQVLVNVKNYTSDDVQTNLTVELNGQTLLTHSLEVDATEDLTVVLPVEGRISGASRAVIDYQDDLTRDNEAFAVVKADEPFRVMLLSPGNRYLESVLDALPNVAVTVAEELPDDFARQYERYAVIVIDRIMPDILLPGNYLLIDVVPDGLSVSAGERVGQSRVAGKHSGDMLRDIEFGNLVIDQATQFVYPAQTPGLRRLFWSERTDLAVSLIENELRMVLLGFNINDSNFPLQASFPLFLAESLAWLHPRSDRHSATQIAPGTAATLLTPDGDTNVLIQTPDGQVRNYNSAGREFQFQGTFRAGIYRYEFGNSQRQFAVSLNNEDESNIIPRSTLQGQTQKPSQTANTGRIDFVLWPYLLLIAVILLILEWGLWCWRGVNA